MKYKIECGMCDTKIRQQVKDKFQNLPNYNEITVTLNNKSDMVVGVCDKHADKNRIDTKTITRRAHLGWKEEVKLGIGNNEWVRNHGLKLKAVGVK